MAPQSYELHNTRIYEPDSNGEPLRDASELLNEMFNHKAQMIALPVSRLGDDFFRLKTRIAGEMLGKLTGYRMRVAIVGDVSRYVEESDALRDFVRESNRGTQIWFVADRAELEDRLRRE
jgi:hypothetical protein